MLQMLICIGWSQDSIATIGNHYYGRWDNKWYTIVNEEKGAQVNPEQIIVKFATHQKLKDIDFEALGVPIINNKSKDINRGYSVIKIPLNRNPFISLEKLYNSGKFNNVFMDIFGELESSIPKDDYYLDSWNLVKINMSQAWDISAGTNDVRVAVIDVGTQYDHPDLIKNKWSGIGYDFWDEDPNPEPDYLHIKGNYHGTAVAGVICSSINNDIGVSGIAGGWGSSQKGLQLMSLRIGVITESQQIISLADAAQAFDYARVYGAHIISCSWNISDASGPQKDLLEHEINQAVAAGIIVVFSSGNAYRLGGDGSIAWPASMLGVIAVGATTTSDLRKEYDPEITNDWSSRYGPDLDISAPGINLPTTDIVGIQGWSTNDYYLNFSGTSAAAPHVAGLAGLVLSFNPFYSSQEVINLIYNNAYKNPYYSFNSSGWNSEVGFGRIDAYATLQAALNAIPLSVNITGPDLLLPTQTGTFTANPDGGSGDYTNYKWWKKRTDINEDWFELTTYEGLQQIQYSSQYPFKLKVRVFDSNSDSAYDIHTVEIESGDPGHRFVDNRALIYVTAPEKYSLSPAHPNPFNPSTAIRYDLPKHSKVTLVVYDLAGREIMRRSAEESIGYKQFTWDGTDSQGKMVPSGVYFYQVKANRESFVKKMALIR